MSLKILTFNWHESYIHLLAKTGYEFDVVQRMIARYPDAFERALTADDVVRIHRGGRIAADDDSQKVFGVYVDSFRLEIPLQTRLDAEGIRALEASDRDAVRTQLFGHSMDLAEVLFQSELEAV